MADPPKYEFAKLELKPGDVLAIKVNDHVSLETINLISAFAKTKIPEGVFVLVLGPSLDLMTITRDNAPAFFEGQAKADKPAKVKK